MYSKLPEDWKEAVKHDPERTLLLVEEDRKKNVVFPTEENVFLAFHKTPIEKTKVVLIGQDPYHGPGQAHGLSFSVLSGKCPPSLQNIFKELKSDLGISRSNADLSDWAEQGVLLLNSVLTVRSGSPNSHRYTGWEKFTDSVIEAVNSTLKGTVFVLWGANARAKKSLIDRNANYIHESAHPSPLSAHNGFFGSRPFSTINKFINGDAIKW